jgi:hypothetical protein
MSREKLKQDIDRLNEVQLEQVEQFIADMQLQSEQPKKPLPFWQTATREEWLKDFREWTTQFPKTGGGLPDEAYDRESIYGE